MSVAKLGDNNPNFGKNLSAETKAKLSEAIKGITRSAETKALLSEINKGENNPMSKKVFVYTFDSDSKGLILHKLFDTCSEAAKELSCSNSTISYYLDKNKLYKKQWILSTTEIPAASS
jgi:group I intron endonuclease